MSSKKFEVNIFTTTEKQKNQIEQLEALQGKTFVAWTNHQLVKKGYNRINDVTIDFQDGVNLIYLVEALFDIKIEKNYHKSPTQANHKIENVALAFEILKANKLTLTFDTKDITNGNKKLTLDLIWILIMHRQMLKHGDEAKPAFHKTNQAKSNLLNFCKKQLEGYEGINIKDMKECFYNGLAFCGLVHKLKPELIDYHKMLKATPRERLKTAFETANQLGIPQLLDVNDMCNENINLRPDEKCIMTYVSEFPLAFLDLQNHPIEDSKSKEDTIALQKKQEEIERKEALLREENNRLNAEKENLQKEIEAKAQLEKTSSDTQEQNKKLLEELERLRKENKKLQEDLTSTKNKLIGKLKVDVIEARNLPVMDIGGKSDPYCRLKVGEQEYKTRKKKRDLNPHWDQQFEFFIADKRSVLEIAVWDWDRFLSDDFIGKVSITISDLKDGEVVDKWYRLHPLKSSAESPNLGEIHLSLQFTLGK